MAVLVAYATGRGSTRGVAERIGARLDVAGLRAEVRELGTSDALGDPDAVVLGSAVYASAGSRPRRRSPRGIEERTASVGARGYRVFAGVIDRDAWRPLSRLLVHAFGGRLGDNRDWERIEAWADEIAGGLRVP